MPPKTTFQSDHDSRHRLRVLQDLWQASGHLSIDDKWVPMTGGRTNHVWRITRSDAPIICKLYPPGADTPLFTNNPQGEAVALRALSGKGLTPDLIASLETPLGHSVLLTNIDGDTWRADETWFPSIAAMLGRLHRFAPPAGLPNLPLDASHLRQQCEKMIAELGDDACDLVALRPELPTLPDATPAFLHGDPVPGNILVRENEPVLIDWQCPAIGDACDDLSLFLSPAMQAVNGAKPLSRKQENTFLNAYGNSETITRLQVLRPYYHWRMALYCRWKTISGDHAYRAAEALEVERLAQPITPCQPKPRQGSAQTPRR
ncbi:MAG TPA: aminoglycoside phosphotransferase family protein [Aliiroseovarius sp.]|nr:aminoglycoside phosphotransferase family protein [Aliiroseovarius sp.]